MMIAALTIRRGVRNSEQNPRMNLSEVVGLGARWRERLWIISCCFRSRFSAINAREPPGRNSVARVVSSSKAWPKIQAQL